MKTKLFKSFMAMLAIATAFAFTGCSDDETDSTAVDPTIGLSTSSLAFTQAEETKTVDVTSNADWKAEVPADASWVTVTPASGNGNKTVNVAVAANATGAARTAEVKFTAMHPSYGAWDNKTLTISQSAGDEQIEELETIFTDNFDKVVAEKDANNYWPYFDAKYMNPQGSAAAGVTYAVSEKNITVRANSASNSEYSDYEGSGSNNIFFGKTPNKFVIENIALPADKDCYVLTFGSEMYDNNNKEAVYDLAKFHVYVSGDNTKWSEVTYAFAEGDDLKGRWNDATASFKLASVPEKLSIKFVADVASVYRLDDVALATGGEGAQTIDLAQGTEEEDPGQSDEPSDKKEVTVTEAISTESGTAVKVKESTVVAVSARSYLLTDGTSYILAYKGEDPGLAVGDKVTVEGSIGAYRNVPQIASPVATKTGHDDSFKHPEATVMDGAAADAFLESTYIKYVKVEGNLVKSGSYWNLAIEGASKAQGSVSYPTAEMCPDSYDGKKVAVYGYTLYQTRDTDVNVIATSIEVLGEGEGGDDEPAEVKKVSVDEFLKAAEDNTVYELTGKIANVVEGKEYYGNFDLVDDSGTVYVYGIKKDGEYGIFETLGLKAGDTITVQGNRGSYKDVPQMINGVYISHVAGEGGEGGDEPGHTCDADVCVDFTVAANYPAEFPVASANKIVDRTEYTFGGNKFAFAGSTGAGFYQVTGKEIYVLFGKKGAYVEFPAIEGKSLKKVVATSRKGASATVEVGVTDTEGNAVNGGAAIVWAQTEPYTFTYELTGTTANTAYRLTVANDKNAQITHLALYYVDGDNGSAGEGGDEPDVPEVKEMTIAEVIAAEKDTKFKLKESTVVAISKKGLMLYDGANYIYAYAGSQPEVAVGDKVTVEGKKGSYNNMPQIASPVVTKTGTDASFAHPAVVEMNGAAVDAFQNDVKIQYVKVAGKLTISGGKYFNLAVEGATAQGSLDNPLDAICPADYDGKDLVVYGYTLYTSSSNKYVNIITTAVEVVEPTPGEDEGGSGDGNEDLPLAPSTEWDTKVLGKWTVERAYASPSGLEGEHDKWNQSVAFEYVKLVSDGLPDNRPVIDDVNKNQRYWTPFKKWEAQFIIFNISSEQIAGKPGCYAVIDIVDRAGGGDTNAITANNSYFDSNTETLYFDFVCNSLLYTAKMTNRTDF